MWQSDYQAKLNEISKKVFFTKAYSEKGGAYIEKLFDSENVFLFP